jgi:hypothetical protein
MQRGKERAVRSHGQPLPIRGQFCNPASGWEKGQIEKNVQDAPSALAADAQLPHASGAERLAGNTLPGAVGSDAARLAS